jgi:hypothetical protein
MFQGEVLSKKHSNDFFFKDSYTWISPKFKTLHWSKTAKIDKTAPRETKYITLCNTNESKADPNLGTLVDTLISVKKTSGGICMQLTNKHVLELKMSSDRAEDWMKVLDVLAV